MKLKKIVKHLDYLSDIKVWYKGMVVWKGNQTLLEVASWEKKEMLQYIANTIENIEDNLLIKKARKYMNYKLDTVAEYNAITIETYKNKYNVEIMVFNIYIKK